MLLAHREGKNKIRKRCRKKTEIQTRDRSLYEWPLGAFTVL